MGWLENLRAKTSDFSLGVAGRKPARTKTPRDVLLQSLDDSIAYLKDPQVYGRFWTPARAKAPDLVYAINGTQAKISLRYSRARLKLDSKNNELTLDIGTLPDALAALREGVANGEFDDQLDKIKASRSSAAKAARSKKAK